LQEHGKKNRAAANFPGSVLLNKVAFNETTIQKSGRAFGHTSRFRIHHTPLSISTFAGQTEIIRAGLLWLLSGDQRGSRRDVRFARPHGIFDTEIGDKFPGEIYWQLGEGACGWKKVKKWKAKPYEKSPPSKGESGAP
jgi:hypothetical protein